MPAAKSERFFPAFWLDHRIGRNPHKWGTRGCLLGQARESRAFQTGLQTSTRDKRMFGLGGVREEASGPLNHGLTADVRKLIPAIDTTFPLPPPQPTPLGRRTPSRRRSWNPLARGRGPLLRRIEKNRNG